MLRILRGALRHLQRVTGPDPADTSHIEDLLGYLRSQVAPGERAAGVLSDASDFEALPADVQRRRFPAIYLLLEKYLVEVQGEYKREQLRRIVQSKYPELATDDRIGLVFAIAAQQEMWLARLLLLEILEHAGELYGAVGTSVLPSLADWTRAVPTRRALPDQLGVEPVAPDDDRTWFAYLVQVTQALYTWLSAALGEQTAGKLFDRGYRQVRDIYGGLETFPAIIRCLPDRLLDEEKIELLSRGQIQQVLLEKADELQRMNDQLLRQNEELESARAQLELSKEQLESRVRARTEQLTQALGQKDILLKEVHHRVKNNMQVICSLLNLQAQGTQIEEAENALRESHDRVRSMALIHEQLYNSPDLASIDFADYIDSLLLQIRSSHDRAGRIELTADIAHPPVDVETGVPCGLIVTELVTNALKHAFAEDQGTVHVSLRRLEDGRSQLCVQDSGSGLPPGLDLDQSDSLGISLVRILARQLHGEVVFENAGGTRVTITCGHGEQ